MDGHCKVQSKIHRLLNNHRCHYRDALWMQLLCSILYDTTTPAQLFTPFLESWWRSLMPLCPFSADICLAVASVCATSQRKQSKAPIVDIEQGNYHLRLVTLLIEWHI